MSEHIYGSSLKAAKSQANYLFEGEFRRKPAQNMSGASKILPREQLLQAAAEERLTREGYRQKEKAAVKIQSLWRSYQCMKTQAVQMRLKFDSIFAITRNSNLFTEDTNQFDSSISEFLIFYQRKYDENRLLNLIDIIMANKSGFTSHLNCNLNNLLDKQRGTEAHHLGKLVRLLKYYIQFLHTRIDQVSSKSIQFVEFMTQKDTYQVDSFLDRVWTCLIHENFFGFVRKVFDRCYRHATTNTENEEIQLVRLMELLILRSLEMSKESNSTKLCDMIVGSLFCDLLKEPMNNVSRDQHYSSIIRLAQSNQMLDVSVIKRAFYHDPFTLKVYRHGKKHLISVDKLKNVNESKSNALVDILEIVWIIHSIVQVVSFKCDNQTNDRDQLISYLTLIETMLLPAEIVTNVSLIQAINQDDDDENVDDMDDSDKDKLEEDLVPYGLRRVNNKYASINMAISRIIEAFNNSKHIALLMKTMPCRNEAVKQDNIFDSSSCYQDTQTVIVRLCNLMLDHEPLAIFHCPLLHSLAFNRNFLHSLWTKVTSIESQNLFGCKSKVYKLLSSGQNLNNTTWNVFLPHLHLFCSLYSYLMPTIDDDEFYPPELNQSYEGSSEKSDNIVNLAPRTPFFTQKELNVICSVLRDICVGLVDILYQDTKQVLIKSTTSTTAETKAQEHSESSILKFKIKLCFKTLVKLVRQLYMKDCRRQFCPKGHWICPSVAIPANKAIDFVSVLSQNTRLLNGITRDNMSDFNKSKSTPQAAYSNEIKTVLILQEIPFVISFHNRVAIFNQLVSKERHQHLSEGYYFNVAGSAIQVRARRNYLYEDAFEKLAADNSSVQNFKLPLKVSLINAAGAEEAGIDGGGLSKEFLSELLKTGFDPMRGFFKSTADQYLYPNPSANVLFRSLPERYETHYEFLGRMLGKAMFEKIIVELPLADFFLAKLLARKYSSDIDLHHLASLDPMLYKNLVLLKNYQNDVSDLNLDFTIANNELGEHEIVELKPNGKKISVNYDNKIEYVHLVADYRLNKQMRAQCAAFKLGLTQLIDLDWLRMFDPHELQILISGTPNAIDVEDWRTHTIYGNGYTNECDTINIFWKVVSEMMNEEERRKLLKFATSCSHPPLLGFKDLVPQFAIAPTEETRLPSASTCMNMLKLPICENAETMKAKLLYAIDSNAGFELS